MISPADVDLIIFDMDGTIIPTLEILYGGIQYVFREFGWELKYSAAEINRYIGTSSGEVWRAIIPPEHADRWEELRDRVRQEYPRLFREHPATYPGVKETLGELRKRGYTLVQYSNASVGYFDIVLDALGIRGCYNYTEYVHENGLSKTELIRKIREQYGNPATAVVGDRGHDIEAARETGCLAIGDLYGYGGEEPRQADITIESFADLLNIFDRRLPVFYKIVDAIDDRRKPGQPFVVGINGIDCSGKTTFAAGLHNYLEHQGREVQLIHLDEFLQNREIRYSGNHRDDLFYERVKLGYQYDYVKLIDNLLKPTRENGRVQVRFNLIDWQTDRYDVEREFVISPDSIIVLEGVFLFIDVISPYIDLQVFLNIPHQVCLSRARARDPEDVYRRYEYKYLPAQKIHLAEYPPSVYADIIVDNTRPEKPVII